MNSNEKKKAYNELIGIAKEDYSKRMSMLSDDLHMEWGDYCEKQINLWAYWQGSLSASIMLVGQDWGNYNPQNRELDRIMSANFSDMDQCGTACYFDNVENEKICVTDRHLMELFGAMSERYNDIKKKNDDLFFTNLCLGYRSKGFSGGLKNEWLQSDLKYYIGFDIERNGVTKHVKGLLEIVEPDVVICLGKKTYETLVSKICGNKVTMPQFYKSLDEHSNYKDVIFKGKSIRIYAMAHPGGMGTANRARYCKDKKKAKSGLDILKNDWKAMGKSSLF